MDEQAPESWTRACMVTCGLLTGSSGTQGIALAVGLAATKHLQEVWSLLERLGHTKFLRSALMYEDSQVGRPRVLVHVEQGSTGQTGCQPPHAHDTRAFAGPASLRGLLWGTQMDEVITLCP